MNVEPGQSSKTRKAGSRPRSATPVLDEAAIAKAHDAAPHIGISIEELTGLYFLDTIKGLGPQACKQLHERSVPVMEVLKDPGLLPTKGKRGDKLRERLRAANGQDQKPLRDRAIRQILAAEKHGAKIVTYGHPSYPPNLYQSNYPVPILYVRGSLDVLLGTSAAACVGSRKIRPPYAQWEEEFVRHTCAAGFTVVSGFALGADKIAHETAWHAGGKTICVMAGGLDRPFPPENRDLWNSLLEYPGAAMVSESPFGAKASSLTLRKRNKLIVAFSRGVLIAQSGEKGGAMNAYRFALEQRKPVAAFVADGSEDTSGNDLIGRKEPDGVLPNESEAYERWLQKLSSLTWTGRSGTASFGMPDC